MTISLHTFLLLMTAGSALLAAWTVARFPRLAPERGHAVTAALIGAAVVVAGIPFAIGLVGKPLGARAAIFLVALPGCVYLFLAAAWVILFVLRGIKPYLR